jgi:hypothetical protein
MRKQTDFDVRVFQVTNNPAAHGGMTHDQVSLMVKRDYLVYGWEVLSSENISYDGNNIFVQVSFVKYEDVIEEAKAKK